MPPLEQIGMFGVVEGQVLPIDQAKKKIEERKAWVGVLEPSETYEQFQELHSHLCSTLIDAKQKSINGIEQRTNKKYTNTFKKIRVKSGTIGAKELNELRNTNQIEYLTSLLKHINKAMIIATMNHKHFEKETYYTILKAFKNKFPEGIKKENLETFELFLASRMKIFGELKKL